MMGTRAIEIGYQDIICLDFKPDSAYFVAADRYGSLRQRSASDGVGVSQPAMKVNGHISAMVVSANGQWIVSGSPRERITVWNTVTQKKAIEVTKGYRGLALDISSDSTRFASGLTDNTVRIFDITSGIELIHPLWHQDTVIGVKFSPHGDRIATATNAGIRVYDTHSWDRLFEVSVPALRPGAPLAWSSDGQQLFATSEGEITCLNTVTHSCSKWPVHEDNNRSSIIVTSARLIARSAGSSVSFWDSTSHEQIGKIIEHGRDVSCIAISHDARYLACGHSTGITVHRLEGFLPQRYLDATRVVRLPLVRVSATVLESWMQGSPMKTEALLSSEIAQWSDPSHDALATRALIRSHLGEWRTALEDAEKSLQIRQSLIGQIAKSIALVGLGEQEIALDDLDLLICKCDSSDTELLFLVKSIILFECNKRGQAVSRLRHFVNSCDKELKYVCLQVLGMMYLKQEDYANAVLTLGGVLMSPFTTEERGPLMTIFIMFNWNFENLKSIAWERLCDTLYASGTPREAGDTLLKTASPLPADEGESVHGRTLQEIITRSGDVTLLAWTGKSSACNSCLPSLSAVYGQPQLTPPYIEAEQLDRRIAELQAIVPLADALMTYGSITRSPPVRFAHFRLLLPCIVFRVKNLSKGQGNAYRAETAGLGDIEFTTVDSLPLKESRKLVFVHPWIHHLRESRATWEDEDRRGSDVELITHGGANVESNADVEQSMIEEVPPPTSDTDAYTQALQLLAHLGQPFSTLLLLRQSDGTFKRVAADHGIVVRGIEDDFLRDMRVEFLEVL